MQRHRQITWMLALLVVVAGGCGDDDHSTTDAAARPDAAAADAALVPDAAPTPDAAGPADLPVDPRLQPFADRLEAERLAGGVPGVAAVLIEDGEITFARGFGTLRTDGTGGPVRASTQFRIGSVTKMMTAAVVLQDVAAGRIGLDDAVTDVIPDFTLAGDPTWAPSMKIRHLLTHASGIYDFTPLPADPAQWQDAALSEYLTGPFADIGYLMAPAGRMWNYSNPNFALAGLAIERAGGAGYRAAMRDRLFEPLGMTRTTFLSDEALAAGDVAYGLSGYLGDGFAEVAPGDYENAWARPAGFAWSTVWDVARFVQFVLDGDEAVLPDAERVALHSPQIDMQTFLDVESYGFGVIVDDGFFLGSSWYATRLASHGGDIPGYAATAYWLPEARFAVITLASRDGAHFGDSAGFALGTLAPLPAPGAGPDVTVDPAAFDDFAGAYQDDFNIGAVTVSRDGDTLRIAMPDVEAAGVPYDPVLQPLTPGNFLLTAAGTQILVTFLPDEAGRIEYLRTRFAVARRAPAGKPRRSGVAIDGAALRRAIRAERLPPALQWR